MDNKQNLANLLQTSGEADYILIFISLFFCVISSFILMYVYRYRSNSISPKLNFSRIIPLISIITFLVILIVNSSLALSLGLVGALSVIRFRTPVKEPEDLAYLFCAIALGIGFGALQFYITTLVFIILIILIWMFLSKAEQISNNDYNLILEIKDYNDISINQINEKLKLKSKEVKISKIEKEENKIFIYYNVVFQNIENLNGIIKEFDTDQKIKFTLYENKIID